MGSGLRNAHRNGDRLPRLRLAGDFCGAGDVKGRNMAEDALETLDAVAFARRQLGFFPDRDQQRVLESDSRRTILNCTRQWGKSTVTAVKAVHRALSETGGLALVMSPSARQSAEFLRKAATFLRKLQIKPRGDGDNEISLLLPNGARIVGLPGPGSDYSGILRCVAAADR